MKNATAKKYEFTPEMDEISGFGGGYEATCRKMLKNACLWGNSHPEANPKYSGFKEVYGLCTDDNADAKALDKAIMDGINDATGAMHQAVVSHYFFIRKNGWEKYIKEMSNRTEAPR